MNGESRGDPVRPRPGPARAGAARGLAAVALLAAACGGGPAAAAHLTVYQRELAYAQCMRAHGMPSWPDPNRDGTFSVNVDAGSSGFQSADHACAHLEGSPATGARQLQIMSQLLKHAACMRSHGITNWPDPTVGKGVTYIGGIPPGVDPDSPQVQSATRACQKFMRAAMLGDGS